MKNFCIIGLSCFGLALTHALLEKKCQIMVIDEDAEAVNGIADQITGAVIGDPTSEAVLRSAGVADYECAVVCIDNNMTDSILATLMLKELGVEKVVARAMNERHKKVLNRLGVDMVVFPEEDMGDRLAQRLVKRDVLDYYTFSEGISIAEIHIPKDWEGHTMIDLNIRRRYGLTVIAVRRAGRLDSSPNPEQPFGGEDIVTVMGTEEKIEKLTRRLQ